MVISLVIKTGVPWYHWTKLQCACWRTLLEPGKVCYGDIPEVPFRLDPIGLRSRGHKIRVVLSYPLLVEVQSVGLLILSQDQTHLHLQAC